jgi:hypothetical protein
VLLSSHVENLAAVFATPNLVDVGYYRPEHVFIVLCGPRLVCVTMFHIGCLTLYSRPQVCRTDIHMTQFMYVRDHW